MILDKDGNIITNYDLDKGYLEITQDGQYNYTEFTKNELDIMSIEYQIRNLKELLDNSDYKAIKYLEGYYTDEEYETIRVTRQSYRNQINRLESELSQIKSRS